MKEKEKKSPPNGCREGDIESKRRVFKHEASQGAERCLYVYYLLSVS